jgi:glycosyltransferase involved in cell wall biosynthesis
MKVIQVVPSIQAESAGPSYSVPALANGIRMNNVDVELHFLDNIPSHLRNSLYKVVNYPRRDLFNLGRSPEMYKGLRKACQTADIIHNNSIWMLPNLYPSWVRKGTKCKQIEQPRGTLSAWAMNHSKWKKKFFWWLWQKKALQKADMFVATAENEYEDIRRLGFKQPIAILPNGIDLPDESEILRYKHNRSSRRRMFFLSRIHPKKNLEILIQCWSRLEDEFPEWDLSIIGPDTNNPYADEMKSLVLKLGCRRVIFEGELKGTQKLIFVAESECMVLPTHSENFGMVIAEALAAGTPAICSYGAPWEGLNKENCGWWIPTNESSFYDTMKSAMLTTRKQLDEMGWKGRVWMARDFSWEGIGAKMKETYAWLLGQGDKPDCVRLD